MEKYEKIAADALVGEGPYTRLIMEVREQIQEDLLCYLDGRCGGRGGASARERDTRMKDRVCELVVENFNKLLPPKD